MGGVIFALPFFYVPSEAPRTMCSMAAGKIVIPNCSVIVPKHLDYTFFLVGVIILEREGKPKRTSGCYMCLVGVIDGLVLKALVSAQ